MTPAGYSPAHHRAACAVHVLARADQRGVALSAEEAARLEATIERLRPAFERPAQDRYWLTIRRHAGRARVLYDTRLRCLVTVWRDS